MTLQHAPVAQWIRALPSEGRGHTFNPCRAHHATYINFMTVNQQQIIQKIADEVRQKLEGEGSGHEEYLDRFFQEWGGTA